MDQAVAGYLRTDDLSSLRPVHTKHTDAEQIVGSTVFDDLLQSCRIAQYGFCDKLIGYVQFLVLTLTVEVIQKTDLHDPDHDEHEKSK
jgi:hypothetical protein